MPSKNDFLAQFQRRLITAQSIIGEAIGAHQPWREVITGNDHVAVVARALLTKESHLVGAISERLEADDLNGAVAVAHQGLAALFADDPFMLTPSICLKPVAFAFLKARWPHRQSDELKGLADRADAPTLWQYRYDAMHGLAAEGKDVAAIAARIDAAHTSGSNML